MRDPIDDAFSRLQADIAVQTSGPGFAAIAGVARRRRRVRLAGVAAVSVILAGSVGVMATENTPRVADPAGGGATSGEPTPPNATPTIPDESPSAPVSPTEHPDTMSIPDRVWMQADDLPWPDRSWRVDDPLPFSGGSSFFPCVRNAVAAVEGAEPARSYVQEAVATESDRPGRGEVVYHHVVPSNAGSEIETGIGQYLSSGINLYQIGSGDATWLLAINSAPDMMAVTYYVGDPSIAGAAVFSQVSDPATMPAALVAIADKISPLPGDDPYLPEDLPDGVWLQANDLRTVVNEQWSLNGPTEGVSGDTPRCIGEVLSSVDGVMHQRATSASGDAVIHYAYLSSGNGAVPERYIQQCADVEMISAWDGTVTSSAVLFVVDELQPYPELYWLALSHFRNGTALTVYLDEPPFAHPYETGFPRVEDFAQADLTFALRDLAGHIGAVNEAYIEACVEAGACN